MRVRSTNSHEVLAQHDEVAQQQGAQRRPARRGHRAGGAAADARGRCSVVRAVISPAVLPGEVDEHGLQARLGDRQVDELESAALGRGDDPRDESLAALHMQLDPVRRRGCG